jgi:predicted N-acetyltransferase YhbS
MSGPAKTGAGEGSGRRRRWLRGQLRNIAPFLTLLFLVIFFSLASPSFLSLGNFANILTQISITGMMAAGLTFVILCAEIDLSAPRANDFEALARDRADVRSLERTDLEEIARIDRRIMGRDRSAYIGRVVEEALTDSAIRVSLVAHEDKSATGFIMASVDFGGFGRTEPVAVIDTIGVDPGFTGAGIGTALLSQLFVNLEALHVERVETVVARENFGLLEFFYRAGFDSSQRLGFVKRLGTA